MSVCFNLWIMTVMNTFGMDLHCGGNRTCINQMKRSTLWLIRTQMNHNPFGVEDFNFGVKRIMTQQVDLCWKHRIFAVVEGAFDEQRQPLMEFLERKKSVACKISGKASTGEVS